jgi:hypothetical protein
MQRDLGVYFVSPCLDAESHINFLIEGWGRRSWRNQPISNWRAELTSLPPSKASEVTRLREKRERQHHENRKAVKVGNFRDEHVLPLNTCLRHHSGLFAPLNSRGFMLSVCCDRRCNSFCLEKCPLALHQSVV